MKYISFIIIMTLSVGLCVFAWSIVAHAAVGPGSNLKYIARLLDGMDSSIAYSALVQPQETTQPTPEVHVVQKGESLWRIAQMYYGDGSRWTRFQVQHDPNLIHPGERLVIAKN